MALPTDEDEVNTAPPASDGSSTVLPGGIVSPEGTTDPNAMLRQATTQLYQALQSSNQPVQLPSLRRSPSDGTRPGWLGLLGEALSGGQTPLYHLSGQQEDLAGSRALMNFGINMMLASGPNRVRPSLFGAAASGLQGAQESMDRSQQLAYTQAGQQFQQQKEMADLQMQQQQNRIRTLQAALPLLTLQARTNMPSLYGGGGTGTGTAGAGGQPGDVGKAVLANGGTPYDAWVADREGIAPNQGALGYGQFRPSTWNAFAAANPDLFKGMTPDQILAARTDPATATKAMAWLRGQNGSALSTANVPVTGQTLGMSHYLGAGTVAKLWNASDTDPVSKYVSADAVKLNPELGTMTVGDMKKRYAGAPDPNAKVAAGPQPTVVATAPPGVQPVSKGDTGQAAPPGVQIGGLPPAPPGGYAGPYAGGGIGSAMALPVPPIPPPAVAGSPIPAGRLQTTGKPPGVAGDVGAILRGQQLAQATPVIPGTGLATGPPGVGKPAALAAPPFIGNYNDTPATPPASTVTPPAVPAPQTTTMATRPASQTAPVRDLSTIKPTDMTQPEWLKYYRTTPTPQELVDRGVVQPADAPEFRKAQADLAKAEAAAAANRAAAQNAANQTQSGLMPQDQVARLIQASNDADKTVEAARDKYTTLLHDTTKTDAAGLAAFYKEQDDRNATDYKNQVVDPRAAAILAKTEINKDQLGLANNTWHGYVDSAETKAGAARQVRDQLEPAMGMVGNQPTSVFVRSLIDNDPHAAAYLKSLGIQDPDKVDAQTNLRGILSYVASEMKPTGTGALREYEMNAIRNSLGAGTMSLDAQRLALARVLNLHDRIINEADAAGELWGGAMESGDPRKGLGTFQKDLDTKLGPVIHDATKEMPQADLADPAQVGKWISSGVVAPHRPVTVPVYDQNGQLVRNPNGTIKTQMRVVE